MLQEFDVDIAYRPGKKNVVCDTLSRHPLVTNAITTIQDDTGLDPLAARKEQDECAWILAYKQGIKENSDMVESLDYVLIDDILYKIPPKLSQELQLVLSENSTIGKQLITKINSSQLGTAHLGTKKTYNAVAKIQFGTKCFKTFLTKLQLVSYVRYEKIPQCIALTNQWQNSK